MRWCAIFNSFLLVLLSSFAIEHAVHAATTTESHIFDLEAEAGADTLLGAPLDIWDEEIVNLSYHLFDPTIGFLKSVDVSIDGLVWWQTEYTYNGSLSRSQHYNVSAGMIHRAGASPPYQNFSIGSSDDEIFTSHYGFPDGVNLSFPVQGSVVGPGDLDIDSFVAIGSFNIEVGVTVDLGLFPTELRPEAEQETGWNKANFSGELTITYGYDEYPIANAGGPYKENLVLPIQFDASDSNDPDGTIVSYEWDFGDDSTGTGVNPTHAYGDIGIYTVELTVTDNEGATDTDSTTIEIFNLPPVADHGGPYFRDIGEPVQFDAFDSYDPDGSIVSYEWDFGDGDVGTEISPTHTYTSAGTYQVILTVTDNYGGSDTVTTTASIGPGIHPPDVSTYSAQDVSGTSAKLRGYLVDDGGESCESRFRYWIQDQQSQTELTTPWHTITDHFSVKVEQLLPGTVYRFLIEARNSIGMDIGSQRKFTSLGSTNSPPIKPKDDLRYIAIAAGYYHSLALKEDGSIFAWGSDDFGQATPPPGNDYIAITAYRNHNLALKSDGSIIGWGENQYGEIDVPQGNDFVAISTGSYHSLALKSDGSIVGWGRNDYGQATPPDGNDYIAISAGSFSNLALKSDGSVIGWGRDKYSQTDPPEGNDFVALAASSRHSAALKSDGSLVAWGDNRYGKSDVPFGNEFVALDMGIEHGVALKSDGSLVGWGTNGYGQTDVPIGNAFKAVAAGGWHNLALRNDGTIVGWGFNNFGQTDVPGQEKDHFLAIAASRYHSLAIKSDGSLVGWGSDDYGQASPPPGNDYIAITVYGNHSLALKSDGSIVGWGENLNGEIDVPQGNDFVAVETGIRHSLALKSDGSIVCWGLNDDGQATAPDGNDFVAISAGTFQNLALRSDGSIVAWGRNRYGQGDPPEGNNFVAIASSSRHSAALKSDGSLVGWGDNRDGKSDVPSGNDFVALDMGVQHGVALKSDGSLVGWGSNDYGQTDVPAGNDFIAVATGGSHNLALRSDGTIVGWGRNDVGQATPP